MLTLNEKINIRNYFNESNKRVAQNYLGRENLFYDIRKTDYVDPDTVMTCSETDLLKIINMLWKDILERDVNLGNKNRELYATYTALQNFLNDYSKLQKKHILFSSKITNLEDKLNNS